VNQAAGSRGILLADAAGCAVGAVVTVVIPAVLDAFELPRRSRWPVCAALTGTALLLARGARTSRPEPSDLARAALTNGAWVAACLALLPSRRNNSRAVALLATTAVLDGLAGSAQWILRSEAGNVERHG
jgi:hypothetical protein